MVWTILRPGWFAQNFSEGFFLDGVRAGELALPTGAGAAAFVDADDIAAVAVAALTEDGHDGEVYELSGPRALGIADVLDEIAKVTGARAVATDEIYGQAADIYAPCALGGGINDTTIPQLAVEIVAGAANNQLLEDRHGDELEARGIRRFNLAVLRHVSTGVNTLPSGHVAASVAAALAVAPVIPAAGAVAVVLALSIALASVLGRYHYAVDAILGAVVAVVAFVLVTGL